MYKPFWLSVWQLFFLKISTDVGLMLGNVINLSHTSKWNKSSLRRILKSVDILSDCRRNSMMSHGLLGALPFTKQEPILSFFFPTNEPILSFKTYTRTIPCRKGKKIFVCANYSPSCAPRFSSSSPSPAKPSVLPFFSSSSSCGTQSRNPCQTKMRQIILQVLG